MQELPSKEDILQYYITENHSKAECSSHFSLPIKKLSLLIKQYGISKSKEQQAAQRSKARRLPADDFPPESELRDLYVAQLRDKDELAEIYSVPVSRVVLWLKRYGIAKTHAQIQQTIARKNQEKYGKPFLRTPESLAKAKETNLLRYGVENPALAANVRKKIGDSQRTTRPDPDEIRELYIGQNMSRKECAEHYGVTVYLFEDWLREFGIRKPRSLVWKRTEETNIARYGCPNPMQNEEVARKAAETNVSRYGVPNSASVNVHHFDVWSDRDELIKFLKGRRSKPSLYELSEYFNVHHSRVAGKVHEWNLEPYVDLNPLRSRGEDDIIRFLEDEIGISPSEIEISDREALGGYEIDIYLPAYRFGIEYNGSYWHSDAQPKYSDHNGRSTVHQRKSLLAESKGIMLFHVFEHEWDERYAASNPRFFAIKKNIENRLRTILGKNPRRIAARKCELRQVQESERKPFMDEYHIQGAGLPATYSIGLYYQGALVSCMSFRRSKNVGNDWELSRFCSIHGTEIQGGASRLFSHFVKDVLSSGQSVVSYSDISKTNGAVYGKLGFACASVNMPNYWWINLSTYDVRSRYQEQAGGEAERMHENGYVRVCDSGTKTWVYTKA